MPGLLAERVADASNLTPGQVVFRQHGPAKGFRWWCRAILSRKAERFEMRVTLGSARPGDLVELAAALGDGHHTYTLTAVTPGSLLHVADRRAAPGV